MSEMLCKACGATVPLYGTVIEDDQFFYQEGQRTKHGSYDPSNRCRYWIDRIQAHDAKDEIPKHVINAIIQRRRTTKIRNIDELTCEKIRDFLRETKNTEYNDHVPLIRKLVTGITPPQLTEREIELIVLIFGKAVKIYDEIKPKKKSNVPYHPYMIYKIIEQILKGPHMAMRRTGILQCIHLQSRQTLISNDNIWKVICEKMGDIDYIPTDS